MVQITQMLRRAVQINPTGPATICEGRARNWREFEARVARLAGAMTELGYSAGDRIGILALNSDRYLEYFFAMAWGGFVFVPINTRLAPPEIVFWLTQFRLLGPVRRRRVPRRAGAGARPGARPSPHRAYRERRRAAGLIAYEELIGKGVAIPDAGK